eukprot:m.318944 g.318944  ORF g.318944 m.318944 type:complete len:449 (+) comp20294_c0_seq1:3-1349(+)
MLTIASVQMLTIASVRVLDQAVTTSRIASVGMLVLETRTLGIASTQIAWVLDVTSLTIDFVATVRLTIVRGTTTLMIDCVRITDSKIVRETTISQTIDSGITVQLIPGVPAMSNPTIDFPMIGGRGNLDWVEITVTAALMPAMTAVSTIEWTAMYFEPMRTEERIGATHRTEKNQTTLVGHRAQRHASVHGPSAVVMRATGVPVMATSFAPDTMATTTGSRRADPGVTVGAAVPLPTGGARRRTTSGLNGTSLDATCGRQASLHASSQSPPARRQPRPYHGTHHLVPCPRPSPHDVGLAHHPHSDRRSVAAVGRSSGASGGDTTRASVHGGAVGLDRRHHHGCECAHHRHPGSVPHPTVGVVLSASARAIVMTSDAVWCDGRTTPRRSDGVDCTTGARNSTTSVVVAMPKPQVLRQNRIPAIHPTHRRLMMTMTQKRMRRTCTPTCEY